MIAAVGVIEAVDSQSCLLHTESDSLDEAVVYVGLFDFPFTVHEPPELVTRVRELAERFAQATPQES